MALFGTNSMSLEFETTVSTPSFAPSSKKLVLSSRQKFSKQLGLARKSKGNTKKIKLRRIDGLSVGGISVGGISVGGMKRSRTCDNFAALIAAATGSD